MLDSAKSKFIRLNRNVELSQDSTIELLAWAYEADKKLKSNICLFSDVCKNSFVNGFEQPLLAVLYPSYRKSDSFMLHNPIKFKTVVGSINRFLLYIRDEKLTDASVDATQLSITLLFRNVRLK